jgi:hypothetical protein
VRPCVSASSIGIAASHQRPSRTRFPANLMSVPCKPFAESLARVVRSLRRGEVRTPRVRHLSKRHAGCHDAGTASRTPEDVSPTRASSQLRPSVPRDVSRHSCSRGAVRRGSPKHAARYDSNNRISNRAASALQQLRCHTTQEFRSCRDSGPPW